MPAAETGARLWFLNTLVTVRVSSGEGSDGISVLESLMPRGDSPPLHIHHTEDELFQILEGEFRFQVGDGELRVAAGDTLLAPKGVPHTYIVESERGRCLSITCHGDFERLVASMSRPAERDELPAPVTPTPELIDALTAACREVGIEFVGPPLH